MTAQVSKFPLSPIPSMLNFISTTSNSPMTICLPTTTRLHSLSLSSSSSSSSLQSSVPITNSSQEHSFAVNYLINSCGLSPDEALAASKFVNFTTPTKPDIVLSSFKNYGFPEPNIAEIVKGYPRILLCNWAKTVLPKLNYLFSRGISVPEIVDIVTAEPAILKRSLDNVIIPAFKVLKGLVSSDYEVINVVKKVPCILSHNPEVDNVMILREVGVSDAHILVFLSQRRRLYQRTADNFRKTVEEVTKLGFVPSSSKFVWAIRVLRSMRKSTWEKKVEVYEQWGLSKDEILMAFQKTPKFITLSERKINRIMDFLVNKMGIKPSVIAGYPTVITLSFKKRIVPRCLLYQVMMESGCSFKSIRKLRLFTLLCLSENNFLGKILATCEEEGPEFLKLYQETVDILQGNREFDLIQNDTSRVTGSSVQKLFSDETCSEKIKLFLPYLDGSDSEEE